MATRAIIRHSIPDTSRLMVFIERLQDREWVRRDVPDYVLYDQEVIRRVQKGVVRIVLEEGGSVLSEATKDAISDAIENRPPQPEVDPIPEEPPPDPEAETASHEHSRHSARRGKK